MFDSEFDRYMQAADDAVFNTYSVSVSVNGGEPVQAIYEEKTNEFDALAGIVRQLTFRRSSQVRVRRNDEIKFLSTGKTFSVSGGPYFLNGDILVTL